MSYICNAGRPRPIKVVLRDSSVAYDIFRRTPDLKHHPQFKHLTITSDNKQQARQQLLARKQAGETNIKLKFISGVPTIVRVPGSEN